MRAGDAITLERDVVAVEIPSGYRVTLPRGTRVEVTQALGGAVTVALESGALARVAAEDTDALGGPAPAPAPAVPGAAAGVFDVAAAVDAALRSCYDPEIPVNIVELGLVYACRLVARPDGATEVQVEMTLTAPGCGMADVLAQEVQDRLRAVPGVAAARVAIVFEPPWDPSRMSEAARLELGLY